MATKYGPAPSSFAPPRRVPRNGASREDMLKKRVLPLAELAAEVARGNGQETKLPAHERLRKFGSTIAPIPVPLAPGETEQEYESKFLAWLATRGISSDEFRSNPNANRERTTRCSYANYLAKAFLAKGATPAVVLPTVKPSDELEEGEEVDDKEAIERPLDLTSVPRKMLNATQVMTLAEYREDVASRKYNMLGFMTVAEKMRKFGLPVVPIAVPLAIGETEQQYEERFLLWLVRAKRMTLGGLQNHKVPMLERYMRLEFASLNGKGLQRFVPPRTPPGKRLPEPAEMSPAPSKKAKTGKVEMKKGTQKKVNPEERPKTDQPFKPVAQEEASRVRLSPRNNAVPDNTVAENSVLNHQPCHPMLARRVLKIDDYVAELREPKSAVSQRLKKQLGVPYVPIPVPLEPGDTEEQYEQRFQDSVYASKSSLSPGSERVNRYNYAVLLAREYEASRNNKYAGDKSMKSSRSERSTRKEPLVASAPTPASALQPSARNTKRYVDLEQYRRDCRDGVFEGYKMMTDKEKTDRFGIPVIPILEPLARGESAQQYEGRFADWLETHQFTTVETVRNKSKDRWYRVLFAKLNGKGEVHFDPQRVPTRKTSGVCVDDNRDEGVVPEVPKTRMHQDDTDSEARVCQDPEVTKPSAAVCSASDPTNLDECTKCRCDVRLVRGMQLLSETISATRPRCTCPQSDPKVRVVLDLTLDDDNDGHAQQTHGSSAQIPFRQMMQETLKMDTDDVEEKLQGDYDRLNEQIILNQEALDASVAELASNPPVDIQEMTQLHEENEEVRALIEAEYINRTQALALLVLYQWRNDPQELKRMVRDDRVSDVVHVQQLSHRKCVVHASAVAMAREQCASLQQQITDSRRAVDGKVSNTQQLDEEFAVGRSRMQELQYQRRYECVVLVHFDQKLRNLLESLLGRVDP